MGLFSFRKFNKAEFKEFGCEVESFTLERDGRVDFAQWRHPSETPKVMLQADVDSVRHFVREGDTVIDVGAHTGDTTVPMALAAGADGCAIALEPNPYVFGVLERNAALNTDKTNIIPLNYAATDADGTYTFHYSDASFCNGGYLSEIENQKHRHKYPLDVQGRNLESLLQSEYADRLERLSYIKIDAEGYDKDIIRSIAGTLKRWRPVLVTEVYRKLARAERDELYDTLRDCGYSAFTYREGGEPRGEAIGREGMMSKKRFDILAIPDERANR